MTKVALVTGANQGLGLALIGGLVRALGEGSVVYLTARDEARGLAAIEKVEARGARLMFRRIDVTVGADVESAADEIARAHGGIDVVISNAAARIVPGASAASQVRTFVETNNLGTHRMLRAFIPILRDGGRFVVVASAFGRLSELAPSVRSELDPRLRTLEDLESALRRWVALVEAGDEAKAGWPSWINVPSKVAQVAALRRVAADLRARTDGRDVLLNAVCPGLVDTEASRPWFKDMSAAQSPDQAAVDVVWLATLPAGVREPFGELVQHRKVLAFNDSEEHGAAS